MAKWNEKEILQFDLDFNFIREFSSQKEAVHLTWISAPAISNCVRGHSEHAGRFRFFLKLSSKRPYKRYKKPEVYKKPTLKQEFDLEGYRKDMQALQSECDRYTNKRIKNDIDPYYS